MLDNVRTVDKYIFFKATNKYFRLFYTRTPPPPPPPTSNKQTNKQNKKHKQTNEHENIETTSAACQHSSVMTIGECKAKFWYISMTICDFSSILLLRA